jgi:hypothetical protein
MSSRRNSLMSSHVWFAKRFQSNPKNAPIAIKSSAFSVISSLHLKMEKKCLKNLVLTAKQWKVNSKILKFCSKKTFPPSENKN